MKSLQNFTDQEIKDFYRDLKEQYTTYLKENLSLDMSRGKPSPKQLNLSEGLLDTLNTTEDTITDKGLDTRNYGGLDGIPEAKELFSQMLEVSPEELVIGANTSLNMMYIVISLAMLHGEYNSEKPWGKLPVVKFICPSPGYDRHFSICEHLGIEMITIDMRENGPDMDEVEKLLATDDSIKGIWCVPKYSNPDGITYADETVARLASMETKAVDFRIFWDNAYSLHHLSEKEDTLKNIFSACKDAGNPDRVYIFGSTSKITYAGAGVAMMATGTNNLKNYLGLLSMQTIGPDKINQLRHVRFLKNLDNIKSLMKKHAAILKPKFDIVLDILDSQLGGADIATWSKPNGGYFISLNTMDGCAGEVVKKASEAGVTLTNAGATYPYGKDPHDRNIRLAPSYPSVEELKKAIEIVVLCVKIVSIEKILKMR